MSETVFHHNWRERIVFSPQGPRPQILLANDRFRVILAGLEAGQQIPPHPEVEALYLFLEGTGWMTVGEERFAVKVGDIVIAPDGIARGIEAESRLAFCAVRS